MRIAIGWSLLALSGLAWIAMFAIPLVIKGVVAIAAWTACAFLLAEIVFWLGLVVLGSSVAAKLHWLSLPFLGHRAAAKASSMNVASLAGQTIAIIGASGGLGAAIAEECRSRGARIVAVVRDAGSAGRYQSAGINAVEMDLADTQSVEAGIASLPALHAAIFATGIDVRAPLAGHSDANISSQLRINLEGPMLATRALVARVRDGGLIAHVGGFADGRLALPYYSVDAASRAGLAAFCEAATRELKLEGRDIVVSYLCPEPTDTAAERPYLELWRRMGSRAVSAQASAKFVVNAVQRRSPLAVMGLTTSLLAKLNALSPGAANAIALNDIGRHLRAAFGAPSNAH